ncbi:MAG: hypothetical protein JSS02_08925 [Planctomycetes bacterium]|nr:hypothetical protein [Planctomycetota bacterium]
MNVLSNTAVSRRVVFIVFIVVLSIGGLQPEPAFARDDGNPEHRRAALGTPPDVKHDGSSRAIEAEIRYGLDRSLPASERQWLIENGEFIRSIKLSGRGVDDETLEAVAAVAGLETLHVFSGAISDTGVRHLRRLKSLHSLRLFDAEITGETLGELVGLKRLSLTKCSISDRGIEAIARLPRLSELDLKETPVSDHSLAVLRSLWSLERLDVSNTEVTAAGLRNLSSLTNLVEISVPEMSGDDFADAMADCKSLEWFNGAFEFSDVGLQRLGKLKNLRSLYLTGNRMTEAGISAIASLPRLGDLRIENARLSAPAWTALRTARSIRQLGLYNVDSRVTDLDPLAEIDGLESLQIVDLPDGIGIASIAGKMLGLRSLAIEGRGIDDEGLKELAALKRLIHLSVRGSAVTDDGLQLISGLPNLISLDIQDTRITDMGIPSLLRLEHLSVVCLPADITDRAKKSLQLTMPQLAIQ